MNPAEGNGVFAGGERGSGRCKLPEAERAWRPVNITVPEKMKWAGNGQKGWNHGGGLLSSLAGAAGDGSFFMGKTAV